MRETLKVTAAALRDADIPFVLAGGFAAWACGAPPSDHDLDLMLKPEDAERALEVLAAKGMRTEVPPEEWLVKAYHGDVMVDLIFEPRAFPVDDELIARSPTLEVEAVRMRVLRPTDLLASKLLAMREHEVDYDSVLEVARSLREQIDWDELRERTEHSPFAKAFLMLARELDIAEVGEDL
jgi:predicted nucleotidyltransferase